MTSAVPYVTNSSAMISRPRRASASSDRKDDSSLSTSTQPLETAQNASAAAIKTSSSLRCCTIHAATRSMPGRALLSLLMRYAPFINLMPI